PTVSVSFGYLAVQSVELATPERTEVWMFTVCAAPPPKTQSTQITSVGGSIERPACLMKRFELISRSPERPQSTVRFRNVIRVPPITWIPSWCRTGPLAKQRTLPPSIERSCTPCATLTPSPTDWLTTSCPIRPVQPSRRWTASRALELPSIVTVTESRSTGPSQTHIWLTSDSVLGGGGGGVLPFFGFGFAFPRSPFATLASTW